MKLSTVYGSLMHHRLEWDQMAGRMDQAPYSKPPQAPVLYIKPANTFHAFGQSLHLPKGVDRVQARSCLGVLMDAIEAPALAQAYSIAINNIATQRTVALLCDFTLEQASWYRPPLRFNAIDGSLALPNEWILMPVEELESVEIETWVNGQCVHRYRGADWVRSADEQQREVSRFIAWEAGDVLMMGCPGDAPWAHAGDVVESRMNGQVFTRTEIAVEEAS